MALVRHKEHLSGALVQVAAAAAQYHDLRERAAGMQIAATLGTMAERSQMLFDACHEWLLDPSDPTRYELGPRAEEVWIIVETLVPKDGGGFYTRREKRTLQHWIGVVEGQTGGTVVNVESKHADPRKLILEVQDRAQSTIEMFVGLVERSVELQAKLDEYRDMAPGEAEEALRATYRQMGLTDAAVDGLMRRLEEMGRKRALEAVEQVMEETDDG